MDANYYIGIEEPGLTLKAAVISGGVIDPVFRDVTATFHEDANGDYEFIGTNLPTTGYLYIYTGTIGGASTIAGTVKKGGTELEDLATIAQFNDEIDLRHDAGSYVQNVPAIVAAVLDELLAGHTLAGSVGLAIGTSGSAPTLDEIEQRIWIDAASRTLTSNAGTGDLFVTITVDDGTDPVVGALVFFQQVGNTADSPRALTDSNGQVFFLLFAADYRVAMAKIGLTFTTIVQPVIDATPLSYSMTPVSPVTPSTDPTLATLWGDLRKTEGGAVAANVPVRVRLICKGVATLITGGAMVRTAFDFVTDNAGHFEEPVPGTDMILPSGSKWKVTCDSADLDKELSAPGGSTINVTAP